MDVRQVCSGDGWVVTTGDRTVSGWSAKRLPFDGKGWALAYRDALRAACGELTAHADEVLVATYASTDPGLADVENVLTYNLGTACLVGATRTGLALERSFTKVEANGTDAFDHHVSYEVAPVSVTSRHWKPSTPLASATLDDASVLANPKPGRVWAAATSRIVAHARDDDAPLLVDLRIAGDGWRGSPLGVMKPLVDGLLSAMHSYSGSAPDALAKRGSAIDAALSTAEIAGLLQERDDAPLGPWPFLLVRGAGVQFSPADDRIVGLRIVRDDAATASITCEVTTALPT